MVLVQKKNPKINICLVEGLEIFKARGLLVKHAIPFVVT